MVSLRFFGAAALLPLALARAPALHHRKARDATSGGRYVKLPLHAKRPHIIGKKRQDGFLISNQYPSIDYYVNITIGGNQTVPVQFDTGSPFTWVNPDCAGITETLGPVTSLKDLCLAQPRYDSFTSTSARQLNATLNNTYGTGSVLASWFTDDFTLGSVIVKNQQFGVAVSSKDLATGILGVGGRSRGAPPTIVDNIRVQGQIDSAALSMDLRAMNETGSIIFGGFDTKKYKCALQRVPTNGYRQLNMTNIGQTYPNGSSFKYDPQLWKPENSTSGLRVVVDSGTPTNLLPNSLYFAIGDSYPDAEQTTDVNGHPFFKIPCTAPGGTFDFTFEGNVTVKVPYQDAIYQDYTGTCSIGFTMGPQDTGAIPYILADSFLRGTYIVFDEENHNIWLGESDNCGSEIVSISRNGTVPQVPGCKCATEGSSTTGYAVPTSTTPY